MNNLLDRLVWSGFEWYNYYSDESGDYSSYWNYSFGFYLKSFDIIITTEEYINIRDDSINFENNIFNKTDVIYYAHSDSLNFEIKTTNFNLFLTAIEQYIKLPDSPCFPLIELASDNIKKYFSLKPLDMNQTYIMENQIIQNNQENLDILEKYCIAKDKLNSICY